MPGFFPYAAAPAVCLCLLICPAAGQAAQTDFQPVSPTSQPADTRQPLAGTAPLLLEPPLTTCPEPPRPGAAVFPPVPPVRPGLRWTAEAGGDFPGAKTGTRPVHSVVAESAQALALSSASDWIGAAAGADLQARGPGGVQADVSVRGSTFSQTLVLLDGQPLADPQTAHHNLDLPVNAAELERAEVMPGPASSRFGSEAFGGVVNLVPRAPGTGGAAFSGWGGSFGTLGARLLLPWSAGAGGHTFSCERGTTAGYRPDTEADWLQVGYAGAWQDADRVWSGRLGFADKRFGAADFYGPYPSQEHTRIGLAVAALRAPLNPAAAWAPSLSFRWHEDDFILDERQPEFLHNRNRAWSLDGKIPVTCSLPGGGHAQVGLEFHPESLDSANLGRHLRIRAGGYAFVESRGGGRWTYDFGVRADGVDGGSWEWSPSAGVAYRLTSSWSLRASAGRAFRLPSFTELYYVSPSNLGNPDLRPEQAWSVEAGLDGRPAPWLRLNLTGFRREETDGIDMVRTSSTEPWRTVNLRRVLAAGGEAEAEARLGAFVWTTAFVRQVLQPEEAEALQSKYQLNAPTHRFRAALTWTGGGLTPGVSGAFIQRPRAEGYWLLDAVLTYSWAPGWSAYAKITNGLNTAYEDIPGVPLPGRGFWCGLDVRGL